MGALRTLSGDQIIAIIVARPPFSVKLCNFRLLRGGLCMRMT